MSKPRVIQIREHLHTIPEPSTHEEKTSAYLADQLRKAGFEVNDHIGGYGVVGVLKGDSSGPVVAVRADMDALPHVVDGVECFMHTCGHDANCAIALSAAEDIKKRGLKKGTLKIIFQPAEENLKGAIAMADAGVVDDVDYLLGVHLRPAQEAKLGEATPALCHGSSAMVEATITGVASHGARPHLGVNPIDAGSLVVNAINAIHVNPSEPWSVKVTKFNSNGKIINAVPDGVEMAFDIRAQSNQVMAELQDKVVKTIESAATVNGAKVEVRKLGLVPGADYDDAVTEVFRKAIVKVLGEKGLMPAVLTPGGDDFHFYKIKKPALKAGFVGIGADLTPGLHNPQMQFDERALQYGVDILKDAILQILEG